MRFSLAFALAATLVVGCSSTSTEPATGGSSGEGGAGGQGGATGEGGAGGPGGQAGGGGAGGTSGAGGDTPFGNTTLRVDTGSENLEEAMMDVDVRCDIEGGELQISASLTWIGPNDDGPDWEGVFDLPPGDCMATFNLRCDGEILCIGSQTLAIGEETVADIVLVCSLEEPVCGGAVEAL